MLFVVDGSWSEWSPWSLCSKTCGHQEEVRTRVCENQRNGGSYCSGDDKEVMPCNDYDYVPCPGKSYLLHVFDIKGMECLVWDLSYLPPCLFTYLFIY